MNTPRVSRFAAAIAGTLAAAVASLPAGTVARQRADAPPPVARPRLIVLIAVDQFRGDYVQLYGGNWTGGLHDVFTRGAYFPSAAYPYGGTKTCAGHATIGTGTLPSTHGMIDNEWFDTSRHAFTTCTEDPSARSVAYAGAKGIEQHSARWLRAPTLADVLTRVSPGSRVVSMSVKPRAAIGLGGHGGPNVTFVWSEDTTGVWTTTSAFARVASPIVSSYISAHPLAGARGAEWKYAMPDSAYQGRDDAPGEPAPSRFPHWLDEPIRTSRTSATFADIWEQSPWPDAYLGDLARSLVERMKLGQQSATDMLAISFSSLDAVGHRYGPRSHEVQDTLARLDQVLGRLIADLDRLVGREHYVLGLSADHGVAEMPEQIEPATNAGRVTTAPIAMAVEDALDAFFGRDDYVEAVAASFVYFKPGVFDKVRVNAGARGAVENALLQSRGVARVFWADDLASISPTDDDMLTLMRKSYAAGRSGDVAFVLKPNWMATATGTTHGTPYLYDRQVPVAFFGAGVGVGRYPTQATPVDVAPTLAALAGLSLPKTDGRVLAEAIAMP